MSKKRCDNIRRYLTIDPGTYNPAICVMDLNIQTRELELVFLEKDNWTNYKKQIPMILNHFVPDFVFVEFQPNRSTTIRKYGHFIEGFCAARGMCFGLCAPIAYKKGLKKYGDRKKYSIELFLETIRELKLNFTYEKYKSKLDDIADAFNMNIRNIVESKLFASL